MTSASDKSHLVWLTAWFVRIFQIAVIIILLGLGMLAFHVIPIYQNHNRAAQEVLDLLVSEPLPTGATVLEKDWNISNYEGAGNLCEAGAFLVIQSNAPREEILGFYRSRFPGMGEKIDSDFHIAPLDDLPPLTLIPGDVNGLLKSFSPAERKMTYVVWGIRPLGELGWDIRGW